ncbi:9471_t:CDS:1, partial [Gigaspora rosea]
ESGDSAGQNNNRLWSAQQLYQAPYYLQNSHPFSNQNFIYTTQ